MGGRESRRESAPKSMRVSLSGTWLGLGLGLGLG
jgi:hypothetical protein